MNMRYVVMGIALVSAYSANGYDLYLDGDTPETGSYLDTSPLLTTFGTILFDGELTAVSDVDQIAAGAEGNVFDIFWSMTPVSLIFDFDIESISFNYGGNSGGFWAEVRDENGIVLDSFLQTDTGDGFPAGPVSLSGLGIRSLFWNDENDGGLTHAAIDNVEIVVPAPASISLLMMGSFVIRRRR
ncbi:MAG: hypothetical protein JKY43_11565 [Phycisphaerales bacterium]|nr:hypothetical protein [Phycisphaerales bacterium]